MDLVRKIFSRCNKCQIIKINTPDSSKKWVKYLNYHRSNNQHPCNRSTKTIRFRIIKWRWINSSKIRNNNTEWCNRICQCSIINKWECKGASINKCKWWARAKTNNNKTKWTNKTCMLTISSHSSSSNSSSWDRASCLINSNSCSLNRLLSSSNSTTANSKHLHLTTINERSKHRYNKRV